MLLKELNLFDKKLHERISCLQIEIFIEILKEENASQIDSWIYNNEIRLIRHDRHTYIKISSNCNIRIPTESPSPCPPPTLYRMAKKLTKTCYTLFYVDSSVITCNDKQLTPNLIDGIAVYPTYGLSWFQNVLARADLILSTRNNCPGHMSVYCDKADLNEVFRFISWQDHRIETGLWKCVTTSCKAWTRKKNNCHCFSKN